MNTNIQNNKSDKILEKFFIELLEEANSSIEKILKNLNEKDKLKD